MDEGSNCVCKENHKNHLCVLNVKGLIHQVMKWLRFLRQVCKQ
jgi:hypothetical protein